MRRTCFKSCGKAHQLSPLVFYAAVLNDVPQPKLLAFALRCSSASLEGIFRDERAKQCRARNHLKGETTEVLLGTVTALITVKVGDNLVESVITKRSAELEKGRPDDRSNQGN
jgi:molybdopterin-binding protein